jgi:hypothetical protein
MYDLSINFNIFSDYKIKQATVFDAVMDDLNFMLMKLLSPDKMDVYIGSSCDLFTQSINPNAFRGTIGRLYLWKSIPTIAATDT